MSTAVENTTGALVVGYAGSRQSRWAVEWTAAEAYLRRRALVVLSTVDPADPSDLEGIRVAAQADVRAVVGEVRDAYPGVTAHGLVSTGAPAPALSALADQVTAVFVAVGTSGAGAVTPALTGSTAAGLVRQGRWPTIVVRGERPLQHLHGGHVVVGLDGSPASEHAAEFAFHFAGLHDCPVHLVHSTSAEHSGPTPDGVTVDELVGCQIADWNLRCPDVRLYVERASGSLARSLLRRTAGAALLVVGEHGHGAGRRKPQGSLSHQVLRHAPCPVAIVREPVHAVLTG
ncbi:universal stress protein [Amycolatopsis suaedae]|nr:universal stress protein [Amycolatopsis suaedae]